MAKIEEEWDLRFFMRKRDGAHRIHSKSLMAAFRAEMDVARLSRSRSSLASWYYEGPDVRPFLAGTEFDFGRGQVSIYIIDGFGERTGRMPVICDAYESFCREVSFAGAFSIVGNLALRDFLLRRGYSLVPEPSEEAPTLIFDPSKDGQVSPAV